MRVTVQPVPEGGVLLVDGLFLQGLGLLRPAVRWPS